MNELEYKKNHYINNNKKEARDEGIIIPSECDECYGKHYFDNNIECPNECEVRGRCEECCVGAQKIINSDSENEAEFENLQFEEDIPPQLSPAKPNNAKASNNLVCEEAGIPDVITKDDSYDKLVEEIKTLKSSRGLNFVEIGEKLFQFKEIVGENNFRKKCQEILGIQKGPANIFLQAYRRFKSAEYKGLIKLIPYSAFALLAKNNVGDDIVEKVLEEVKNNEECRGYKDVHKLIQKYHPVSEIQNTNSKPTITADIIELLVKKIKRNVSDITEKYDISEKLEARISEILNMAYADMRSAVHEEDEIAA